MGIIGAIWGLGGVALLLIYTIYRLMPIAVEAFAYQFSWYHWVVLIINTGLMMLLEGYRGFQKGLSPRMAARAKYLVSHPNILNMILAPFYCMGYFRIVRRRQISTIILTIVIIGFILLVRLLDQPWRGIVDVGVVVGLSWGLMSSAIFGIKAFTSEEFNYSPEIPE
jgi:hypothetical protein